MILKMEKVTVLGLSNQKDLILKDLMKCKCVQINAPQTIKDYEKVSEITKIDPADTYELEQQLAKVTGAISALKPFAPKSGLFSKKDVISFEQMDNHKLIENAMLLQAQVEDEVKLATEVKSTLNKNRLSIASLTPWESLDSNVSVTNTKYCDILYVIITGKVDAQTVLTQLANCSDAVFAQVVAETETEKYLSIVYHGAQEESVKEVLREYNVTMMNFEGMEGTVCENLKKLSDSITQLEKELTQIDERLKVLSADIKMLQYGYDALNLLIERAKTQANLFQTEHTFALHAWVPEKFKNTLSKVLDEHGCYYAYTVPEKGEDFPVLLKNNGFSESFEFITEMYSLPNNHEVDPNPLIAPFFVLFFGMMLSDAGYGMLLVIAGIIGLWKLQLNKTTKGICKMLVMCGVSTVVWGLIYGGWFGDIITVVAKTYFNADISLPKLLDPLADPITIMILSFILGAIHMFLGMGTKAYLLIKKGKPWSAVFDIGFWYFVLIGLVLLLVPGVGGMIGKGMLLVGVVGLILTQGRHEKNILKKAMSGVMSLYDITGYFSDILSYSRILALGLATGAIANVVNLMASLPGANIIGTLLFVAIFLFGHTLNMAINTLGAYVHTSRLQYVEFFGKFYEGGGQSFTPLKPNTKYVLISDKED